MIELTVVIPAYNEASRISTTLRDVASWLARHQPASEIVVVDDGSTDDTRGVVRREQIAGLRLVEGDRNRGKGHAVKIGMLAAGGRQRLFMDADGATPISELPRLIAGLASGADIAIGSRYAPGARVARRQPLYRRAWSRAANRVIQTTLVAGIRDTQCGFKLFAGSVADTLFARTQTAGWGFDIEVLALARRRGLSIVECGVAWSDDRRTRIRPLRDVFRISREFVAIHRAVRRGEYDR